MELLEVTYFLIHLTLQVYKLPSQLGQEIDNTNNVVAECNLSVFDKKAKVAKSRKYKFKAKGIRNEVVLHIYKGSFSVTLNHLMKKMATLLNKREEEWSAQQKAKLKAKHEEKMEGAKKQSQYVNKLLGQSKSLGWPSM